MPKDKVRIPLEDDIWGIEGDWTGDLEKATGRDSEETLFYIKYVPNLDPNQSIAAWLRTVLPLISIPVKKTPEPVPESQINRINPNHAGTVSGVPSMKLHLKSKKDGESPWRDRIGNKLDTEAKKFKDQKEQKESKALKEKAKRLRSEQEDQADENKRSQRNPNPDYLTEEEKRLQ